MQIPTSILNYGYDASSSRRPAPQNTSVEQEADSAQPIVESPVSGDQISEDTVTQAESTQFAPLASPAPSELVSNDIPDTSDSFESSGNASVDQYRQMASEPSMDQAAQDPSLFRVDVYV